MNAGEDLGLQVPYTYLEAACTLLVRAMEVNNKIELIDSTILDDNRAVFVYEVGPNKITVTFGPHYHIEVVET